jgi:hypothetical protein
VSPNNQGKTHFSQIIKTQTNSQIVNRIPRNHGPVTGAHGPGTPGRPIKRSAPVPLGRNSASLEGHSAPSGDTPPRSRAGCPLWRHSTSLEDWTPPRARLRLARGLCAPWGGSPPHSRLSRVHLSRTHSPDRSIKCSNTTRAPGSKANPRHAGPPTPPGNHIPALFRQPSW